MNISRSVALLFLSLSMATAGPRIDRLINSGWKFTREDAPGASACNRPEAGWERISLPHTWNALDGQDGGNDYYRGVGWYRRHIDIPAALRGKSLFLKFDGVSTVAHVYVNGEPAGGHKGGFGAFCIDISPFVHFGGSNVIAVSVTNARDTAVPPLRGDFTVFGGMYRGVHLLVLDRLSVSPLDYASPGVYIRQTHVDPLSAVLSVTSVLRNATGEERTGVLRCVIRDSRGSSAAAGETPFALPPGSRTVDIPGIVLQSPHLWQGREDPYLYRAEVSLLSHGEVNDRVVQTLGLRSFRVDPERGFFLNGRPYPLHGVNRHQDREGMGWAIGMKEQREDFRLIADMGCTAVRLAHYQHAQEFYDLCDRGGMVVWAELALVDEVRSSDAFAECCRDQLRELIKQNFNHPSIVFWSLSNELIPEGREEATTTLIAGLNALAKNLDPARYTTLASRGNYDWSLRINTITDVLGYNLYKGWYEKAPEDFGAAVDTLHSRLPGRPFCISEYGAGAGIHQHEFLPTKPEPGGPWHPEEWQSIVHESIWNAIARRSWIWGSFVWNMFDFASDGRSEGELAGRNDKGLVTYDRKEKKDAFYWYRANWNRSPLVHITGKRFTPRPSGPSEVKVYSNCDSVSLFINGKPVGVKECRAKAVVWRDVEFRKGRNRIEAVGAGKAGTLRDSCTITCGGAAGTR
jgi:beta-galactosidase